MKYQGRHLARSIVAGVVGVAICAASIYTLYDAVAGDLPNISRSDNSKLTRIARAGN